MMINNNRTRGIGLNKNASNIQQTLTLKPADQLAISGDNIDNLKQQLLQQQNKTNAPKDQNEQPVKPIKRLTQLNFAKFNTIVSDENAGQPQPAKLGLSAKLIDENHQQQPSNDTKSAALTQIKLQLHNANQQQANNNNQQKPVVINLPTFQKSLIPLPTDKICEIEDIDKSTSRDAMYMVCDVAKDIYEYLYELEVNQTVREDYLKDQKIFTPKVRHRLVNWCIEVLQTLKLLPETLYLTISIIDRYFELAPAKQQNVVQLVAVGAILIASKYEEIYPPDLNDLIHLTQNAYSRRDIFRIEIHILETLEFNLGKPIPPSFLRRFSKANHSDLKTHSIAKFLMELSLSEYECSHWKPSLLAAAALYVSIHLVNQDISPTGTLTRRFGSALRSSLSSSTVDRWNRTLVHYSHYTKRDLQEPAAVLCKILKKSQKNPVSYTAVKKHQASLLRWSELKSARVDQLIKLGSISG